MGEKIVWLGNVNGCDICSDKLKVIGTMYDAKTKRGSWGLLCPTCFEYNGVGLGIGKGQEYTLSDKEWLKTGG